MKKERESKYEWLRIIAMIMIISHHYVIHGVMHYSDDVFVLWRNGTLINKICSVIPTFGGKVGVALFFMLSGYFLYGNNKFTINKIYSTALFYGLLTFISYIFLFRFRAIDEVPSADWKSLFMMVLFPISGNVWPFITAYAFLLLSKDRLNIWLAEYNKKQLTIAIAIFVFWWTVLGEFSYSVFDYVLRGLIFYCLGGFVKRFNILYSNKRCYIAVALGIIGFSMAEYFEAYFFEDGSIKEQLIQKSCMSFQSLITPIIAVHIFVLFSRLKPQNIPIVNLISSTTLGVYLMHDSTVVRKVLWLFLRVDEQYQSVLFPVYSFVTIISVFLCGCLLDLIRLKVFEPIYNRLVNCINSIFDKLGDQV